MAIVKKIAKKAQDGKSVKGNPKGYNVSTSPMKTGPYEKKLDTVGTVAKSVRMIDGKGKVLGQERLGTSGAEKLAQKFKREKADTEARRKRNKEFLDSRKASGNAASKSIGTMKKGGVVKKAKAGMKMSKKK